MMNCLNKCFNFRNHNTQKKSNQNDSTENKTQIADYKKGLLKNSQNIINESLQLPEESNSSPLLFNNKQAQNLLLFDNNPVQQKLINQLDFVDNQETQVKKQIDYVFQKLSKGAQIFFAPLANIQPIGVVDMDSILVSGDLDGSVGREILLGIHSGVLSISQIGLTNLAFILEEEYNAIKAMKNGDPNGFTRYQSNRMVQLRIKNICDNINYQPCIKPLVIIGDVIHDRLASNKDIAKEIRKQMTKHGAIYILGNHDLIEFKIANKNLAQQYINVFHVQSGLGANDTISNAKWGKHVEKYFRRCYFDEKNQLLFLHNGFEYLGDNQFKTAFGVIQADSIKDFIKNINIPPISEQVILDFTDFRPLDTEYKKLPKFLDGVRIVHGHCSDNSVFENVINLNPRDNSGFCVTANIIGKINNAN